jgi:thiol-disulfide isomerase/thioredoxin
MTESSASCHGRAPAGSDRCAGGPAPAQGGAPPHSATLATAVVALVLSLLLAGCGSDTLNVAGVEEPERVPPRDAYLEDGGWEETAAWIRRETGDDRPVLVNILASWCGPCKEELPVLLEAYEANPDIAFLGIDHLDRREDAEVFLDEMEVTFPTIFDISGEVAAAVEARGMPTTLIFDTDGDLVAHHSGLVTESQLEELLDRVR